MKFKSPEGNTGCASILRMSHYCIIIFVGVYNLKGGRDEEVLGGQIYIQEVCGNWYKMF
jgi:hypothetical protein